MGTTSDEPARRVNDAVVREIKAERARRGLTQRELAEESGIPYRTFVRYMSGERLLSIDQMHRIGLALGMSGPELLMEARRRDGAAFDSPDEPTSEDLG